MKKKCVTAALLIVFFAAGFYFFKPRCIKKSYYGYYINMEKHEVSKRCSIKIEGSLKKVSSFDFGKIRAQFSGKLTIDEKEYELTGGTALRDTNDYFKDSKGHKLLYLSTRTGEKPKYSVHIYNEFRDGMIYIYNQNSAKEEIIGVTDENIDEEKILKNIKEN